MDTVRSHLDDYKVGDPGNVCVCVCFSCVCVCVFFVCVCVCVCGNTDDTTLTSQQYTTYIS